MEVVVEEERRAERGQEDERADQERSPNASFPRRPASGAGRVEGAIVSAGATSRDAVTVESPAEDGSGSGAVELMVGRPLKGL